MKYDYQVKALNRWEFNPGLRNYEWTTTIDGLNIVWDVKLQMGAYVIDDMLTLIHNWDELDSLMEQTVIY